MHLGIGLMYSLMALECLDRSVQRKHPVPESVTIHSSFEYDYFIWFYLLYRRESMEKLLASPIHIPFYPTSYI